MITYNCFLHPYNPYFRMNIGNSAVAYIKGGPLTPNLYGIVMFRDVPGGTMVFVEVSGLPMYKPAQNGEPQVGPHGFHIHENGSCTSDTFQGAGEHWNPTNQPHGNHIKWVSILCILCAKKLSRYSLLGSFRFQKYIKYVSQSIVLHTL